MGIIMIKQLDNNLYTFEIPLPGSPLKWINTYVIKGNPGEKNLLVDTGFNRPECLQALLKGMEELQINPRQTNVFLTHCHSDHTGNAPALAKLGCQVFMGATAHQLQLRNTWPIKHKRALKEGVNQSVLKRMFVSNPAIMYAPEPYSAIELQEGDRLNYGGYNLSCVSTPGHTPGHMCLYDEKKKLMFLGDHVLFDITPNISIWTEMPDALGDYFSSLIKVKKMPVVMALPGHRTTGNMTMVERINELFVHHRMRLEEAENIIQKHPGLNAYQIAGKMTWKIRSKNWEGFPPGQQWFAVGETMTHLDYLLARGRIDRWEDKEGNRTYYVEP